jgi:hypothetical protein
MFRVFPNPVTCHPSPVTRRAVTKAHAHAAQPDGRDFQVTEFALLHI